MRAIYVADSEGAVSVAANTTKTVFGVQADSGHAIDLLSIAFSVDQATPTASDKSVLIEFAAVTYATNAPGTNSTAVTIDQESGPRITETFAAGKNWTTEPTVYTVLRPFDVDPYKFTYERDHPLGEGPDFAANQGFALRVTNPTGNQSVNVRAWAKWARV
jgi:hypothetical protein